ncbi:uncharacterized protein HKW66_Vig0153610 [Vigna angularis]|uniref:Uncharacterized protein n=1 Tax=Phaseolus angularis TaxID=3914 RepID=A0A8T0JPE0_PHAAN|nr:uncharacterized protein HKW66_Vig0153610 [Vigna angularis]
MSLEPGRNCLNRETLYSIHRLNKIIQRRRQQHRFFGEEESQLRQPWSCDAVNVNTKVEPQSGDTLRHRKSKLQVPTPNNLCYDTVVGFMDGEGSGKALWRQSGCYSVWVWGEGRIDKASRSSEKLEVEDKVVEVHDETLYQTSYEFYIFGPLLFDSSSSPAWTRELFIFGQL